MDIYLDNCCLQRPLDDKQHLRIQLESEAILVILSLCEQGVLRLVSSEVLALELDRNPHPQRRIFGEAILAQANHVVEVNAAIVERAHHFAAHGIKAMDALHLACAEAAQVVWFCSCDDRLLRKAKTLELLTMHVVSPLELAEEVTR